MRRLPLPSLLLAGCWGHAAAAEEVFAKLRGGRRLGLSTRSSGAFRLRFLPSDAEVAPIDSPMVEPDRLESVFQDTHEGAGSIQTIFGSVQVADDGTFTIRNLQRSVLTVGEWSLGGNFTVRLSSANASLYGRGASPLDCESLLGNSSEGLVCNTAVFAPYYYSTDGYGALGVTSREQLSKLPARYESSGDAITWTCDGCDAFELYIMPSETLKRGTTLYYELTGRPAVPPRYAFGFIASRWGWENRAYIEDVMATFRSQKFPIDAIICDFEWFTNESDYTYPPEGKSFYHDFGFNPVTFDQPRQQLQSYRKNHFRVGGIRKPRLGSSSNLQMAQGKNWTIAEGEPGGTYPPQWDHAYAKDRVLNYSMKAVRDWYARELAPLVDEGLAFWWNDEGESTYFTFHWWNVAQVQSLRSRDKWRRFFSLNRAWSPGMSRLGAHVWTGDVNPTWLDLQRTPGMMLNWILAGAPYVACDIGGFTGQSEAQLLTRWYQVGVFMPMMRVHSTIGTTPHFPWLWGEAAAAAMRDALDLRYRLVPYHYSLSHKLYSSAMLWIKPLVYEFPDDANVQDRVSSWLDGDILVAPVLHEHATDVTIYLPEGTWYPFQASHVTHGDGKAVQGPANVTRTAALGEIAAYVRAGAIVPLAPVVQSTAQLPGGPLEVQIYLGADGEFELIEDDGETIRYQHGHSRTVRFRWINKERRLTWAVSGYMLAQGPNAFTHLRATLVDADGARTSDTWPVGALGSIDFKNDMPAQYLL